jgi:hypothetical protein
MTKGRGFDMGAISSLSCLLRVCFALRVTQIRYHHPAVRVPQELLYCLHIFAVRSAQRIEAMAKSVPTDVLVNVIRFSDWPDVAIHEVIRPVRLFSPLIVSLAKM